jgi:hypothetical protein
MGKLSRAALLAPVERYKRLKSAGGGQSGLAKEPGLELLELACLVPGKRESHEMVARVHIAIVYRLRSHDNA